MLVSILTSLLVAASSVLAGPIELSNAERLQQGLPLKAPVRRFDPSRTNHLHARASMGPTPQTQGSSYVQVTRVNPLSKRQMTTAGYLSYDSSRSVFQVGSAGAAVGFASPQISNDRIGIQLSSTGLSGMNLCANTQTAGPNGQPYASSFTVQSGPNPGQDYGAVQCFIWFYDRLNGALTARYITTRVDYVFTIDPTTSDLVAWTGATDIVPPMADRVTLKVVHDPVDQPAVAPGGSYNAVLRMSNDGGTAAYNYMQWREMASWQAYFYPGPQSEATVFTVTPSSSDPTHLVLQFTVGNVLKTVAIAVTDTFYCQPDGSSCQASTTLTATPSNYDAQSDPFTYKTDVFRYPSTIQGYDGLIAHIDASGTGTNGQPISQSFDLAFTTPGTNIATTQINPTFKYSRAITVDVVPI